MALTEDGVPRPLPPSRKTRMLLAYLVMSGRVQRRNRLSEMFWPNAEDPLAALRWSLSKIRSLVGPERLEADRQVVSFRHVDCTIDVLALSEAASKKTSLPSPKLQQALCENMGIFLDGLEWPEGEEYAHWLTSMRLQTRAWAGALLDAYGSREDADMEQAIGLGTRLLEADPWNDSIREQVSTLQAEHMGGLPDGAADSSELPVHTCHSRDGVPIAWARWGDGPPLVKAANWLSHLRHDWSSPVWRDLYGIFSREFDLHFYDGRGVGLSGRRADDLSLEAFVADLEAVVDAAGLERFPILGISQGCPVAIAYAVRHPERVSRLLLHGGFAQGWRLSAPPEEIERREAMMALMRIGWGNDEPTYRQLFTSHFMPDSSEVEQGWFNELQRVSTSPAMAVRLAETMSTFDVTGLLGQVQVPTLVTHSRNDRLIPMERGQIIAEGIPGARFEPLESNNHLLVKREPAFAEFDRISSTFLGKSLRA